jgi:hypothetical protein
MDCFHFIVFCVRCQLKAQKNRTFPAAPEKAPEALPEEAADAGAGTETETAGTGTAPAGAQEGSADQHAADHDAEETMERFGGFQFPHPVPQPGNRVSVFHPV